MVLTVKPTSDQLACLLAQGDRRRRVNLQNAPLEHVEPATTIDSTTTSFDDALERALDDFDCDDRV